VRVGSGQTSQIAPLSGAIAGNEEGHRRLRRRCGNYRGRAQSSSGKRQKKKNLSHDGVSKIVSPEGQGL
jgi:hypothetical protein